MTRRDYVLLSAALRRAAAARAFADGKAKEGWYGVRSAAQEIARALAAANPKFDSPRFLRDAGVES